MQVPAAGGRHAEQGVRYIRRGLLYMLMASVIHYYVGGYSPEQFPLTVIPEVTQYLVPVLFLGGLGLLGFGVYRRFVS